MPQPFLGSSLQSFPLAESAHPSRGHYSLAVIHSPAGTHRRGSCRPRFHRLPRFRAVAWIPLQLWTPFPQTVESVSRSPWIPDGEAAPFSKLHLLRSLLPSANPFAPARIAPTWRPMLSWVSAPPEPSLLPRLESSTRPCPKARTCVITRKLRRTTRGTSRPLAPGETFPAPRYRENLVDSPRSPSRPDRTASRRRLYSLGLGHARASPNAP
jgi:hypothetical protein